MNKTLLIPIVLLVILGATVYYLVFWETGEPDTSLPFANSPSNTVFPSGTSPVIENNGDPTLRVARDDGETLEVRNFLSDSDVVEDTYSPGTYYLGNHFAEDASEPQVEPPYVISYFEDSGVFAVGIYKEPIAESRELAASFLMRKLNLSAEDLCTLNVQVTVPHWVNEFLAGQDLGFSFCPGSVPLE